MRADRLLQIVSLLRTHDRLSANQLAVRLEVTARTILRDMEALSAAGVPVYAERGRDGGFALVPGYRPAVENLTGAEVEAVLLAGVGDLGRLGRGTDLSRALRKITDAVGPDLARSAERVSDRIVIDPTGWFGQGENELPLFGVVQHATLGDRRLRLRYRGRNQTEAVDRTVDPYGLLQAGLSWYLIAAHRGRPHTYRIERIESATELREPAHRPADLDLRAVWQQLRTEYSRPPTLALRVEITDGRPNEARIMLGSLGSSPPRIEAGPPMIMSVDVLGVRTAVAALAGLGNRVRVLDPPEVIEALRQIAQEANSLYGRSRRRRTPSTAELDRMRRFAGEEPRSPSARAEPAANLSESSRHRRTLGKPKRRLSLQSSSQPHLGCAAPLRRFDDYRNRLWHHRP